MVGETEVAVIVAAGAKIVEEAEVGAVAAEVMIQLAMKRN